MTAPGGEPPPYVPGAVGSSSDAGPADIWGLGKRAKNQIFLGTTGGRAPRPGQTAPQPGQPMEDPGAAPIPRFTTALEAMQQLPKLYAANRAGYIALQQKLYRGGFYGQTASPQSIGLGAYNDQTINAYRSAVLKASQFADAATPVTFDELLAQSSGLPPAKKRIQPGFVAQYSDPQVVAALAQRAAQTALGRNLTTVEVQAYVREFHAAEQAWNADQKAAAQTAATGTDVATRQAPSAEAVAEKFVQRGSRGTEASGNRLADYVNVLREMVGGGV